MSDYSEFLNRKTHLADAGGFDPVWLPGCLFPHQRHLTDWAVREGRAAVFADCGMGKTLVELVWAENVVRHTNRSVLLLAPLAVGPQIVREGERFGVDAVRSSDGRFDGTRVVVANYERLHHFDPARFAGLACDESSILKNADGKTRAAVNEFARQVPYRLLATATAAPNDYDELGTSSEALGRLGQRDMLTKFFRHETAKDNLGWGRTKWRLKGHAERDFWRWVCSWARACRKPSDLGFSDDGYDLPPLETTETVVKASTPRPGFLFDVPAVTLQEQQEEQRRTLAERCETVAEMLTHDRPAVAWCHLNAEGDRLTKLIPGAVQVSGSDADERKEEVLAAFAAGQIRVLVTKPEICGFGLNWQHCSHMSFFPSHSFERFYQAVRRCWRFGQPRPVRVDMVTTDGQAGVLANLQRKAEQADAMFARLVELMSDGLSVAGGVEFTNTQRVPTWL